MSNIVLGVVVTEIKKDIVFAHENEAHILTVLVQTGFLDSINSAFCS